MSQSWKDAVKRDVARLKGSSTVEEVCKNLGDRDHALVEVEGQPFTLITAKALANLPPEDTLKQAASRLPPLIVVYQSLELSKFSLAQQAETVMLEYPNLAGIVIMDERGAETEGILRRKELVNWIAAGSNRRNRKSEPTHGNALLPGIPELPLVKYVCPEGDYFQYVLSPPKDKPIFCPHHPQIKLLPEES
jgi:hypothetical protein